MFRNVVALICAVSLVKCQNIDSRLVNTDQGPVRGYKSTGENVYSYFSIPYATVPTGRDRFKAPLPPPTWTDPFEANIRPILCPQGGQRHDIGNEYREQCLVANVFTPNTTEQNLPVLIYIHGGAYVSGHGNTLTPKNIVEMGNIVAVTFNYRLGAHGFLCLGTENAPGNAGSKDQVALLRWVQRNIANFGGNPKDVTLAGWSAGSSSADLIMISKITQGLFNKIIPESAANIQAFSVQTNPVENAKWYARQLHFEDADDIKALEEFYLNTPFEILTTVDVRSRTDHITLFSPCLERDLGQEIFLDESPMSILSSGNFTKYPMLYGFSEMEGLFRLPYFEEWKYRMNEKFSDFLPHDLRFANEEEREEQAQMIKEFYFGDEPVGNNNILTYIDYFTDCMFGYPLLRAAKLQTKAGNNQVYLYEYAFVDENVDIIPYTNQRGATHCAQTRAVLDSPDENAITEEFKELKKYIREMWLNFIIYTEPVPSRSSLPAWKPITTDNLSYMSINTTMEYRDRLLYERANLWEKIYNKYYQEPAAPNPEVNNFSFRNEGMFAVYLFAAVHLLFSLTQRIA